MITYLRTGRHVRATGTIIRRYHSNGAMKVKPTREGWGIILVTAEEIEAGKEKPPIQPREKPTTPPEKPKRERKPRPAPVPRWRELVEEVRIARTYGDQFISIQLAGQLADEIEAAQNLFQSKP
jgi:hypothetical protein